MPSIGTSAIVHLLDSAQGQPLQTWRFANRTTITIGRSDDNDIVVANPLVSRAHATLVYDGSGWTLVSTGRHGTIVDSRVAAEFPLRHQISLDPLGPGDFVPGYIPRPYRGRQQMHNPREGQGEGALDANE